MNLDGLQRVFCIGSWPYRLHGNGKTSADDSRRLPRNAATQEVMDKGGSPTPLGLNGNRAFAVGDEDKAWTAGDALRCRRGDDDRKSCYRQVPECNLLLAERRCRLDRYVRPPGGDGSPREQNRLSGFQTHPGLGMRTESWGELRTADRKNVEDAGGAERLGDAVVAGDGLRCRLLAGLIL